MRTDAKKVGDLICLAICGSIESGWDTGWGMGWGMRWDTGYGMGYGIWDGVGMDYGSTLSTGHSTRKIRAAAPRGIHICVIAIAIASGCAHMFASSPMVPRPSFSSCLACEMN